MSVFFKLTSAELGHNIQDFLKPFFSEQNYMIFPVHGYDHGEINFRDDTDWYLAVGVPRSECLVSVNIIKYFIYES
ncbi:MAG: hypothetical protein KDH96_03550 [Candidatus Riesia sp.]|nr:hypothetical protein [Candidatus Riesia sp.]